jgi:oligosaccharide repeat unit polymerase
MVAHSAYLLDKARTGVMFAMSFLAVLALSLQMLAPYLVWPNRWNIPAHLNAGFCITAYVIPGLLTNAWERFPESTTDLYAQINILGAVTLCIGILLGAFFAKSRNVQATPNALTIRSDPSAMIKRVAVVTSVCVLGMLLSYWIMGFIPIFADDPFSARQFKGVYRDPYLQAAYLYRFSFSVLEASIPLVLAIAWYKRSAYFLMVAFAAFLMLFISLSRGPAATGVLFFLGILAARHHGYLKWYLALVIGIFPLGSVLFYVLGQVFEIQALRDGNVGETFSDYVSSGAPDILDQMNWLHGFMKGDYFTWGRTFYGGLIPSNYPWNPAVWSLTYDQVGADVTEIVSGGLRLTTAEWGYANFGWFGVVMLPLLGGMINGFILSKLRTHAPHMTILQFTAVMMIYMTLGQQVVEFYLLSIHNIPSIAAALFFWRGFHVNRANKAAGTFSLSR